jgi:acyl dehydratase
MVDGSAITEELRRMLGVEAEPQIHAVEKGHIKRFAQAVGDANPLWNDAEYAGKSRYGTIVAPPTFLMDAGLSKFVDRLMAIPCPLNNLLNGGTRIVYYQPIKAGDTITSVAKLADLQEKSGKSGKLLFMVIEVTFKNQRGEVVRKGYDTFIRR